MNLLKKTRNNKIITRVPPWTFIGAVVILLPILAFLTLENVNRQKENNIRLLQEMGAALIRSFEAGTRTGMMGMHRSDFRLQRLLVETAQQPDIVYILVVDLNGTIIAHNDSNSIDRKYGQGLDLNRVSKLNEVEWRIVAEPEGKRIFEVYRRFLPTRLGGRGMGMGRGFGRRFQQHMNIPEGEDVSPQIIFVGLDMTSIEAVQKADILHSVMMGIILLLIGFAGIIFLFLVQSYRATEASLSRIKAFSDNLVENVPIGLIALDTEKKIASLNYEAESILKRSIADVANKDADKILPKELRELIDDPQIKEKIIEKEMECPIGNGRVVPLEVSATRLKDENEQFLGYVLLLKDLSEVRTLRKEIARNQRLATVGRLAAGVAHEIRNPLSSIKGFATYFKQRYQEAPEDQHIADIMIQEVDRLNRVVGQLLEFARPVTISKRSVPIKAFIEDSLKLIERQATGKNIQITTQFSSEIAAVNLDPDKMNQVLLNLYLNAIESMETRGGNLLVSVNTDAEKNRSEIRIADNGVGISETDLTHIFDPYFTTKASGTGLGLAIAHKILEGHQGEIKIVSQLGKGTSITLLLPLEGSKDK